MGALVQNRPVTSSSSSSPELTLVLPAWNEASRRKVGDFEATMDHYITGFKESGIGCRLVVFDDGSTDTTPAIAKNFGVTVISHDDGKNHGKGSAIKKAFEQVSPTSKDYIGFTDADRAYDSSQITKLYNSLLISGSHLAVGRRIEGIKSNQHPNLIRAAGHYTLSKIADRVLPTGVHDPQAGAQIYSKEAAEAIWPSVSLNGWASTRQALNIARLIGYKIEEIELKSHDQGFGSSVKYRDAALYIIDCFKARNNTNVSVV